MHIMHLCDEEVCMIDVCCCAGAVWHRTVAAVCEYVCRCFVWLSDSKYDDMKMSCQRFAESFIHF